jgi:hypothetical protein
MGDVAPEHRGIPRCDTRREGSLLLQARRRLVESFLSGSEQPWGTLSGPPRLMGHEMPHPSRRGSAQKSVCAPRTETIGVAENCREADTGWKRRERLYTFLEPPVDPLHGGACAVAPRLRRHLADRALRQGLPLQTDQLPGPLLPLRRPAHPALRLRRRSGLGRRLLTPPNGPRVSSSRGNSSS